jgi:hypothetical protein
MTEERPIWDSQPWKLAVVATVAVAAGVKMLLTDWTLAGLTAFVALLLVASGALRIVITRSFRGVAGSIRCPRCGRRRRSRRHAAGLADADAYRPDSDSRSVDRGPRCGRHDH